MGNIQRLTLPPVGDIMNQANFKKSSITFSSPSSLSETSAPSSPNNNNNNSSNSNTNHSSSVEDSPLYSCINEVENSAHEILKRLSELKMKPNPTKLDTIWLAHFVSCLNSSFYQLHACLGVTSNPSVGANHEVKTTATTTTTSTPTPVLEPINKLFQIASSQFSSTSSTSNTPSPSLSPSVMSSSSHNKSSHYNFETISYETKSVQQSSHMNTLQPVYYEDAVHTDSRLPSHQQHQNQHQNQQQPLKRKVPVFSHQPHKRAYKHSAPECKEDRRCTSCNTSVTPEWRRGPLGPKSLCNACGLQYAKTLK